MNLGLAQAFETLASHHLFTYTRCVCVCVCFRVVNDTIHKHVCQHLNIHAKLGLVHGVNPNIMTSLLGKCNTENVLKCYNVFKISL